MSARSASPPERVSREEGMQSWCLAHLHTHIRSFVSAKFCPYNFLCVLPIEQTFGSAVYEPHENQRILRAQSLFVLVSSRNPARVKMSPAKVNASPTYYMEKKRKEP